MELEAVLEVRDRGHVTIPNEIRKALNIQKGDLIRIKVEKIKSEE